MGFKKADDYIEVPERIAEFRTKYPEGSLQPWDPLKPYEVVDIGGTPHIVVVAAAYRSPDDVRPGVGMAQEVFPGKTPYTKGSELMNAETSAWGRAIVAALAADTKRGIASAEEVRNRQAEREDVPAACAGAGELADLIRSKNLDMDAVKAQWAFVGGEGPISQSSDEKAVGAMRKWVDQQ